MDYLSDDFKSFMKTREKAALAYVQGNPELVSALETHADPASFFGPDGSIVKGPEAIDKSFRSGSANFEASSQGTLEIVQMAGDDRLGYWTGIQHARVKMHGKPEPIAMALRITELFRKEDGAWKLVHRHADMLKPKSN